MGYGFGNQGYDSTQDHGKFGEFEPIPEGKYLAVAISSEGSKTKAGDGELLTITWEVLEGKYKGRKLFSRLNMVNKSSDAERIARAELDAICKATGVARPRDADDLLRIPIIVDVKVKKRTDDETKLTNKITAYYSRSSATEQQAQTASAGAGDDTPPYLR